MIAGRKFVHPEAKHRLKRNKPNYRPHNHHPLQNNEKTVNSKHLNTTLYITRFLFFF